jgi:hypothetical protein
MATKNSSKSRPRLRALRDIHDTFGLHFQGSRRREEILEHASALQAAGNVRDARKLMKQAQELEKHLKALEGSGR